MADISSLLSVVSLFLGNWMANGCGNPLPRHCTCKPASSFLVISPWQISCWHESGTHRHLWCFGVWPLSFSFLQCGETTKRGFQYKECSWLLVIFGGSCCGVKTEEWHQWKLYLKQCNNPFSLTQYCLLHCDWLENSNVFIATWGDPYYCHICSLNLKPWPAKPHAIAWKSLFYAS